jgi:hypothetical protein
LFSQLHHVNISTVICNFHYDITHFLVSQKVDGFQLKVFCSVLFCRLARNLIARFECSISKFQGFMHIVWPLPSVQVLPCSQLIFPSKQKSLKNQFLSHSESKFYQINSLNPAHQDLSNNTKDTFQFLQKI